MSSIRIGRAVAVAAVLGLTAFGLQAGLVCKEPSHHYGTVPFGQPSVSHTFVLENTGTNEVRILSVQKTCGCVTTAPSRQVVPPGETVELPVSVSLAGRIGPQSKSVYVITDDPVAPHVPLSMSGTVQAAP